MQRTRDIAAVCLASLVAWAGPSAGDIREQSSRTWEARDIAGLDVVSAQGLVSVTGSHGSTIRFTGMKVVRGDDPDAMQRLASETRVEADTRGGRLSIRVVYPERRVRVSVWRALQGVEFPSIHVSLVLEVPSNLPVTLASSSGDLETFGLAGAQTLTTASGDITVADALGPLQIRAGSGSVLLSKVGPADVRAGSGDVAVDVANGPLTIDGGSGTVRIGASRQTVVAETTSGDLRVGLAGRGARLTSSSGSVTVKGGGAVRVETSSGRARVELDASATRAEITSGSGDVVLRLARGLACRVNLQSESGEVDVRADAKVQSLDARHLVATLGTGAVPIVVRSSSGNLNLVQ